MLSSEACAGPENHKLGVRRAGQTQPLWPSIILAFCRIMEERHGRSLCTYPRRSWRSVCPPCSPGGGWFLSHVTEPGGILCHSGVHCLREHDFVRGGRFREGIAPTRIQTRFETKGLGSPQHCRLGCRCLSLVLGFSATAAAIRAVSFWEELCHSAGWPSDEAQMRTICVSTGHFHSDLRQRLPLARTHRMAALSGTSAIGGRSAVSGSSVDRRKLIHKFRRLSGLVVQRYGNSPWIHSLPLGKPDPNVLLRIDQCQSQGLFL
jgi:hypothetical protein